MQQQPYNFDVLHMTPPHMFTEDFPDENPISSSLPPSSFSSSSSSSSSPLQASLPSSVLLPLETRKRSASDRKASEYNGDSVIDEDFEATHLLEQTKKLKITTVPGEIRLRKDVETMMQIGTPGIELLPRESCCELFVRYSSVPQNMNVDMDVDIHVPCNFMISVEKYYPHDRPVVRCLDVGFTCIHIKEDGTLSHQDLDDNWSPICALGDILSCIQYIRLFVYKLQSQYGQGSNVWIDEHFDTSVVSLASYRDRVAATIQANAVAYENEHLHMVVDNSENDAIASVAMLAEEEPYGGAHGFDDISEIEIQHGRNIDFHSVVNMDEGSVEYANEDEDDYL